MSDELTNVEVVRPGTGRVMVRKKDLPKAKAEGFVVVGEEQMSDPAPVLPPVFEDDD